MRLRAKRRVERVVIDRGVQTHISALALQVCHQPVRGKGVRGSQCYIGQRDILAQRQLVGDSRIAHAGRASELNLENMVLVIVLAEPYMRPDLSVFIHRIVRPSSRCLCRRNHVFAQLYCFRMMFAVMKRKTFHRHVGAG